ncbi:hypothetical protein ABZ816_37890 [Actinosynnema sp. NPDC047251]|uniref:Uncharacterized protein n=1 Tax=Saccharothrix espanaensis (strain ATCC 51144 / DSM 44229 / JCM 9112 / NBRC 15066 / NRRL 15764) TaxID=1179773 RepID=K0K0X8_SACES|nr:hypothetical protein [Saccharothrix espanaensis]CCH30228.1 hypothetical protein BN6_29180 [Saccharothrix espanaensis DSM 44229]
MDDDSAYRVVAELVRQQSLGEILLLSREHHLDVSARHRLVKFYALLKCAETLRYDQFRGFPA